MKKVILKKKDMPQTLLKDCNNLKSYGIIRDGKNKGFISKSSYYSGEYVARCSASSFTQGNNWPALTDATLAGCIEKALLSADSEVFEFETSQELFAWLAKP